MLKEKEFSLEELANSELISVKVDIPKPLLDRIDSYMKGNDIKVRKKFLLLIITKYIQEKGV